MATLAWIDEMTPKHPPCFKERSQWLAYIAIAQECKPNTRPIKRGVFNRDFPYCDDCTKAYALRMSDAGRCKPSYYRTGGDK